MEKARVLAPMVALALGIITGKLSADTMLFDFGDMILGDSNGDAVMLFRWEDGSISGSVGDQWVDVERIPSWGERYGNQGPVLPLPYSDCEENAFDALDDEGE
ncbi:hypothetical protein [Candidatus Methylacidithermus pantelleriae]|nr:hypothetical protein [Candidatus Methylacidithermus pantelleriae]